MPVLIPSRFSPITIVLLLTSIISTFSASADPEVVSKATRGSILDRNDKPLAHNHEGKRRYPLGKSAAHLTGYIHSAAGKTGLERSQEKALLIGKSVRLTIDASLQKECYKILAAQEHPGAIVVQDPHTGAVLALASYPSFEPDHFTPAVSLEQWKKYSSDKQKPLLNRALTAHTPGAITLPLAALAGEYAGLKNPEIHCKDFHMFGKIKIRDWKQGRDERLRIPEAIETSCGTYFMQLAARADDKAMNAVGGLLRLNRINLKSLPSTASSWPGMPRDRPQQPTDLAMSAIGQAHTRITPLDATSMMSAIATGTWRQPYLVAGKKPLPSTSLLHKGKISGSSLRAIRAGLHLAVHGEKCTAGKASVNGIKVAGLSSTAQTIIGGKRARNSWFTGYAPYEKPQFTVTVFLSGAASGGTFAAPIASEVFSELLKK